MAYLCRLDGFRECDCCMDCVSVKMDIQCPVCGNTLCETFYVRDDEILGCDYCVSTIDATEL